MPQNWKMKILNNFEKFFETSEIKNLSLPKKKKKVILFLLKLYFVILFMVLIYYYK